MKFRKKMAVAALATSALILTSVPAHAGSINGSGATFAQPLMLITPLVVQVREEQISLIT